MKFKVNNTSFNTICTNQDLRFDEKFHTFINKYNWNVFNSSNELIELKEILFENIDLFDFEDDELYFGVPTGRQYIDIFGDIIGYQEVTEENHPKRLKYKVDENKILLSSLRLAKAPALNFTDIDFNKYVFSNGFYSLSVKNGWSVKFVMWLLRTQQIKNAINYALYKGIGISNYKLEDLLRIKVPVVPLEKQMLFLETIKDKENEIVELKKSIKDMNIIINDVFSEYFGFDKTLIEKIRKGMTNGTQISKNNNFLCFDSSLFNIDNKTSRLSTRSQNSIFYELKDLLYQIGCLKVKEIVTKEICRGTSPKYDANGDVPVIKTAHVSGDGVKTDFEEFVNSDFYDNKKNAQIQKGDIVIACTGKPSIGKIDIIQEDIDGIVDGHIGIIRIDDKKYNKYFFLYLFKSILGYFQIERDFVGCTNQIELAADSIKEFLIPNISLEEQEKIVEVVEKERMIQVEKKLKIMEKYQEIEDMLYKVLE